ncbi:hypothetical protein WG66_002928 [Moniliophthora roreri]|nr:hypothetical protein WG66_002928 [Moniliophthora roreri]
MNRNKGFSPLLWLHVAPPRLYMRARQCYPEPSTEWISKLDVPDTDTDFRSALSPRHCQIKGQ